MSDALRAARIVPEFRAALDVTLVETSPTLARDPARSCSTPARRRLGADLTEAPQGPAIVIANEFLDALPVRQYVAANDHWRERVVRLERAAGSPSASRAEPEPYILAPGEEGDVLEVNPAGHRLMFELAAGS